MGMEESEYIPCKRCGKIYHEGSDHICGKNPKNLYFWHKGIGFNISFFENDEGMIFLEDNTFVSRNVFMKAIQDAY